MVTKSQKQANQRLIAVLVALVTSFSGLSLEWVIVAAIGGYIVGGFIK